MHSGRRILVAVEPTVLASALAGVLAETGDDVEVIDLRVPGSRPSAHYDAAVVTSVQPGLDADRVVELPDSQGGPGMARVWTGTHCEDVDLQGLDDLLRVLRT